MAYAKSRAGGGFPPRDIEKRSGRIAKLDGGNKRIEKQRGRIAKQGGAKRSGGIKKKRRRRKNLTSWRLCLTSRAVCHDVAKGVWPR